MPSSPQEIVHLLAAPWAVVASVCGVVVLVAATLVRLLRLSEAAFQAFAANLTALEDAQVAWRQFRARSAPPLLLVVPDPDALPEVAERRSGHDRRRGGDRRRTEMVVVPERRSGVDRRRRERRRGDESPLALAS